MIILSVVYVGRIFLAVLVKGPEIKAGIIETWQPLVRMLMCSPTSLFIGRPPFIWKVSSHQKSLLPRVQGDYAVLAARTQPYCTFSKKY